ncbi:MAG: aminopeptidase [Gammaproteobacteria bacterium]|jgi:predicted aminopeptidase|nr:aminopeptidase [Gammaproteobacteria bacterium]
MWLNKPAWRNGLKFFVIVVLSILLLSCEAISYYSQAARGQMQILLQRQDIQRLLQSGDVDESVRAKLAMILELRDFAEAELLLPVGDNYLTYVDLSREHVIWNVFAAPEFSVDPVSWCYPVAGCVTYRGYFSESSASNFAERLEREGYDVYTGGVEAYSTLGWFDDSLLSTVISRTEHQLAALVFHELSHQLLYVPGDTTFNESFATAVEREGLRRWLAHKNQGNVIDRAQLESARQSEFVELVITFRDRFDQLYAQELSEEDKRQRKIVLQDELRSEYQVLKSGWDGDINYDAWFSRSLNNAQLSTVSSYNDLVPVFDKMLLEANSDLAVFYASVTRLAELPEEEREKALDEQLN